MEKITLKQLHEINNKYPDRDDIHQVYKYDVKKEQWVFKGYSCVVCGTLFKKKGFVDTHKEKCQARSKKVTDRYLEEAYEILDKNSDIWRPKYTSIKTVPDTEE
jgi:hypothetical protein